MVISIVGVALMFASGIIVPLEAMPAWEQYCAKVLPMYYAADAFKGVMLATPADYWRDIGMLVCWAIVGLSIATVLLHRQKAAL